MNKDVLIELWQDIKHFIPHKDRIEVADKLVAVFEQNGMADGIEDEEGLDKTLRAAVVSYFHLDEDAEEDDDDY